MSGYLPLPCTSKHVQPAWYFATRACGYQWTDGLSVHALWPYRPRQVAVGVSEKGSTCYCRDSQAQGSDFGLQEWRLAVPANSAERKKSNRPQLVSRTTPDTQHERRVLRPCPAISQAMP